MKLLTFMENEEPRLGIKIEQGVLDVARAAREAELSVPDNIHDVILGGESKLEDLNHLIQVVVREENLFANCILDEETIVFESCVPNPNKIICVGLNYRKHAEETNAPIPDFPILFNKFNNTINAHGANVYLPKVSQKVDYEAELVIVIGKTAKYVQREEALSHVFGYCNVNDISARDLQFRTHQWLLGKSCDGFSPLGPYLVTADEIGNPNTLDIRCTVNGEIRQHSNTADMIFHCDEIVSYISQHMTLVPGDIILTGTPAGVVVGYPEDKQVYLKEGDVVTIAIEKLGSLTNTMIAE